MNRRTNKLYKPLGRMYPLRHLGRVSLVALRTKAPRYGVHTVGLRSLTVQTQRSLGWQLTAQLRNYSVLSAAPEAQVIDYKKIKEISQNPSAHPNEMIVDVREPVEYQGGHIPGAVNIPFKSSPGALDLNEEEFEDTFGFEKPQKDKNLIFYCAAGIRSSAAEELASTFGYKNRSNYKGSYEDWVSHERKAN